MGGELRLRKWIVTEGSDTLTITLTRPVNDEVDQAALHQAVQGFVFTLDTATKPPSPEGELVTRMKILANAFVNARNGEAFPWADIEAAHKVGSDMLSLMAIAARALHREHAEREASRGRIGVPLSELSGRPGHEGYERFRAIGESWGYP